jgi:GNAT superfamily N-acetyltransferase
MDETSVAERRAQMGRSAGSLMAAGPRPVAEGGPGFWVALSGALSLDANLALIDADDPGVRDRVLATVGGAGVPTTVLLAGVAAGAGLGTGRTLAGAMPFMRTSLDGRAGVSDARVRRADAGDVDVVRGIQGAAFGLDDAVAGVIADLLTMDGADARVWLLTDDGTPVSSVITHVVDDAACVWCMATPSAFERRGCGRAILGHALAEAAADGLAVALLGATPAGKPLYDVTGWTTIEEWDLYAASM